MLLVRSYLVLKSIGLFLFAVTLPLTLAENLTKLSSSYILADLLILATAVTLLGYACAHQAAQGSWGEGV